MFLMFAMFMSCQMKSHSLLHSFVDCNMLSEVYIHCTQHFESGCIEVSGCYCMVKEKLSPC